jgi:hypothetical protein
MVRPIGVLECPTVLITLVTSGENLTDKVLAQEEADWVVVDP